jgi:hypothetical protein
MNQERRFWPFFAVVLLIWVSNQASAQTENPPEVSREMLEKSHLLEELPPPPDTAEKIEALVKKRQTEQYQKIIDLFKQGKVTAQEALKDPAFRGELHDKWRDNPLIPESLKKLLDQYTDPEHAPALSPKDLEELRNFAKSAPSHNEAEGKKGAAQKSEKPSDSTDDEKSAAGRTGRGGGSSGQTPEDQQELAQRVMKWLSGSPAMRKALRDLGRNLGEEDPRWARLSAGIDDMRQRLGNWSQRLELASGERGSWLARILPNWAPHFGLPADQSAGAGPHATDEDAGGSLSAGSHPWLLFAAFAFVILAALAGWSLMSRSRRLYGQSQRQEWKLGPWPVNPKEVVTRRELVQAFEYLSLLNLGPDARNWNHRVIAICLADKKKLSRMPVSRPPRHNAPETLPVNDPLHQVVVRELASIYEVARYAPPGDTLPVASLEAARRDLCNLAGVTAA